MTGFDSNRIRTATEFRSHFWYSIERDIYGNRDEISLYYCSRSLDCQFQDPSGRKKSRRNWKKKQLLLFKLIRPHFCEPWAWICLKIECIISFLTWFWNWEWYATVEKKSNVIRLGKSKLTQNEVTYGKKCHLIYNWFFIFHCFYLNREIN